MDQRLSLRGEEAAILQRKTTELTLRLTELETENRVLHIRSQDQDAKIQAQDCLMEELRKQIHKHKNPDRRPEQQERMLHLIASMPECDADYLRHETDLDPITLDVHLGMLSADSFIACSVDGFVRWSICHQGKEYLVRHGLVP